MNIFNKYVEDYDKWYDANKYAYLSELKALKQIIPKKGKGLEIGVGTGRFAGPLGVSVGIDPSRKMLELAKRRGIKTFSGRGERLPFRECEFDYCLMAITICFVSEPGRVIKEAERVLKKNGKLIIAIVDKDSHLGRYYMKKKLQGHRFYREANFFSSREIVELLTKHGFDNLIAVQTVFKPLKEIKELEEPEKGFGKGGFVAVCGTKTRGMRRVP